MTATADQLLEAEVLVELGELYDAELTVARLLDRAPDDLAALSLFGKIKHMRGQLSQAIACWAQLYQRSPLDEAALLHLRSMLHLARDPERGAGEFLALGQLELMRRPAAHLELEEAFRLFLARRSDEARAHCERVAGKFRQVDRETYKLAVLAAAWIAELSGEPLIACRQLERLGEERGFETDHDRVLALARLYERLGTPGKLEAAVHIYRYLDRKIEDLSILPRLVRLHRRLGDETAARAHEQRYLERFRRHMHRPDLAGILRVAARMYLPLERLRRLSGPIAPDASPREQGLAAALAGDYDLARQRLDAGGEVIDKKYFADVEGLAGNEQAALELRLEALRADPTDLRLIARVLDTPATLGEEGPAAHVLRDPDVARRARQALEAAVEQVPLRASLWRHLAGLATLTGDERSAEACAERAQALERARRRDSRPIGRVLAAGVYHFLGRAVGLIHEVWADREVAAPGSGGTLPSGRVHGNLTPDMLQSVHNTFLSVREYARTKFPHLTRDILDFNYTYKMTKEDEPSGGLSAGLPTALAFLSVFIQRPVSQDLACSGTVVADAHDVLSLRAVGDSEHKVKAAYHRNLGTIVLPAGNRAELVANPAVPAAVERSAVRYAADLDEACRYVFGAEEGVASRPAVGPAAALRA